VNVVGGKIDTEGNEYAYGDTVRVNANTLKDSNFQYWELSGVSTSEFIDGADQNKSSITFIMPNNDVTLTAVFEKNSGTQPGATLDAPKNVRAVYNASSNSVTITWDKVDRATHYQIMYNTDGDDKYKINLESYNREATFKHNDVVEGQTYYYYVRAFNSNTWVKILSRTGILRKGRQRRG